MTSPNKQSEQRNESVHEGSLAAQKGGKRTSNLSALNGGERDRELVGSVGNRKRENSPCQL